MIDKQIIMDNISYFINEYGLKVGEVEGSISVSQGYLSKLSKSENKQLPSLETVEKLAGKFGITIDELLKTDFAKQTKSDKQIYAFIKALYSETEDRLLNWDPIDYNIELQKFRKSYNKQTHPIFDLEKANPITKLDYSDDRHYLNHPINTALFGTSEFFLYGDCYKASISSSEDIYLFQVADASEVTPEVNDYYLFYALAIVSSDYKDNGFEEVIHTEHHDKETTYGTLQWLYDAARDQTHSLFISKRSRNIIEGFLEKHSLSKEENHERNKK